MTSTFIKCAAALALTSAMAGCSSSGGDSAASTDSDQALSTAGRIVTGQNLVFHGVTDDGYVIYATETGVSAVPLEGGTPIVIATSAATPKVVVSHDGVFVWSQASETVELYPLTVWSHSLGQPTLLSAQSTPGTAVASPDSSSIVYIGDVDYKPLNWPGTLYAASLADLAKPTALLQDTDSVYDGGATIQLQFTADSSKLQTAYVLSSGSGEATYATFATSTWAPGATVGGNVQYFATDASGANVAIVVGDGVQVSTADGSTLSFSDIDTTNGVGFAFNDAAKSFVYVSAENKLQSTSFAENAPTTLASTEVSNMVGLSPDQKWALVHTTSNIVMGVASTVTAGAVIPVPGSFAVEAGDLFTADSKYAIALADTGNATLNDGSAIQWGTLNAVSTATGTATAVMTKSITGDKAQDVFALGGSVISFTGAESETSAKTFDANLYVADLGSSSKPTLVATKVDMLYGVSPDKGHVVYTVSKANGRDGLYVAKVPTL